VELLSENAETSPGTQEVLRGLADKDPNRLIDIFSWISTGQQVDDRYMPWDDLRFRTPPQGLNHEEWWLAVKLSRQNMQRPLSIVDGAGKNFSYALPGVVLRGIEDVNRSASGNIAISEQVTNLSTRDRYLINSLIEEAITSSQLEVEAPTPARRLIEVAALGHGAAVNAS
jgi:hypothetical protein